MNKYTRKQINKNALLHDKEFVTVDDAMQLMMDVGDAAIKAGANEDEMISFFKDGNDE